MVSEGDRVHAHGKDLVREPRRDADPVGRVLAVHDACVHLELRAQCGQALLQRPSSRGADDVGDEQDAQGRGLYGTPKVADGNTWMATLFPPSVA